MSHRDTSDGETRAAMDAYRAAADRAGGQHLHQHDGGKHQRHASQGVRAQPADEIGLDQADRGLRQHDHDVRQGEADDGPPDRRLQQQSRSGVHENAS